MLADHPRSVNPCHPSFSGLLFQRSSEDAAVTARVEHRGDLMINAPCDEAAVFLFKEDRENLDTQIALISGAGHGFGRRERLVD